MRVLAFDPGAERLGWAALDKGPVYLDSGIVGTFRLEGEEYQKYRMRQLGYLTQDIGSLIEEWRPDLIANETVPPSTSTAFASNGVQAQLAATAVTVIHTMAAIFEVNVKQVAAVTVKKKIGGDKKASKVKVRNGVYHFFPEIKDEKWSEWVKVHDESDACAVGLTALGHSL